MMKFKPISTLLILFMLIIVSCTKSATSPETTPATSPEATLKVALDEYVKGNYEAFANYWVDTTCNPLPQESRKSMIDSLKSRPLNSYKINKVDDPKTYLAEHAITSDAEKDKFTAYLGGFDDAKIANVALNQGGESSESPVFVVKCKGAWKLLIPSSQ